MSSHESRDSEKLSSFPTPALDTKKSSKATDACPKDTKKTRLFNYEEKKGKSHNFKRPSVLSVSDEDRTLDLIKQRVKEYFTRILDRVEMK